MNRRRSARTAPLHLERLETRIVLSGFGAPETPVAEPAQLAAIAGPGAEFVPVLQAGLRFGRGADSPSLRVDANTSNSPFAAVGSLAITSDLFTAGCSGSLISPTHVLTAAHCLDHDLDGDSDEIQNAVFTLNAAGSISHQAAADSWAIHPDFGGFRGLAVNDDIAVVTLSQAITDVTPFGLFDGAVPQGAELTMAGYGKSGDGLGSLFAFFRDPQSLGYYVDADPLVKRAGANAADLFIGQDDWNRPNVAEVFVFDFDGPWRRGLLGPGPLGGPSLGNRVETQLAFGDSGSPALIEDQGVLKIAGVNTFAAGLPPSVFGSIGGGQLVSAYRGWIAGFVPLVAGQTNEAGLQASSLRAWKPIHISLAPPAIGSQASGLANPLSVASDLLATFQQFANPTGRAGWSTPVRALGPSSVADAPGLSAQAGPDISPSHPSILQLTSAAATQDPVSPDSIWHEAGLVDSRTLDVLALDVLALDVLALDVLALDVVALDVVALEVLALDGAFAAERDGAWPDGG